MTCALALLLLLAPGGKEWSEAHGIGVLLPKSWTVVARDEGAKAFVVEGPVIGDGKPHLVIWNMGEPGRRTLQEFAESFDRQVGKRAGWKRTALVDHEVGPWAAKRLAYGFSEPGKAKGRARISVILFGGRILVLEMSASARGFPAATFDRIEKSLEVRWTDAKLPGGATARIPPGWSTIPTETGIRVAGPREALVILQRDDGTPPEGVKEEGALLFLGEKRPVKSVTREVRGADVQLRWVHHGGWSGVIILPVDAWKEAGPGARAILASLKLPPPRDGKDG